MKYILFTLLLVCLILFIGCEQIDVSKLSDKDLGRIAEKAIVCDKPYIRHEVGCCLDQNNNNICDKDEGLVEEENEEKFLPESCIIAPGFSCEDFRVGADGSASVIIKNGAKATLTSVAVSIGTEAGTCLPTTVAVGATTTCTWAAAALTAGTVGDWFKDTISLTYIEGGSTISHTKTGDLVVKYE